MGQEILESAVLRVERTQSASLRRHTKEGTWSSPTALSFLPQSLALASRQNFLFSPQPYLVQLRNLNCPLHLSQDKNSRESPGHIPAPVPTPSSCCCPAGGLMMLHPVFPQDIAQEIPVSSQEAEARLQPESVLLSSPGTFYQCVTTG